MEQTIKLYAIVNHEDKFFRNKGYGGHGINWVDSLNKARIYPRIGVARAQITFWGKYYPENPTPKLIEITGVITAIFNEEKRVQGVIETEEKRSKKHELKVEKDKLDKATKKVEQLQDQIFKYNRWE